MNKKKIISVVLILCTLIGIFSTKENIRATSATEKKEEAENNLQDCNLPLEQVKKITEL